MVGQSVDDIKLIDFGHAINVKDIPKRPVELFGTVVTVAPEIINKKGVYGCKADCYSLGIVLFELLTSKFPYKLDNVDDYLWSA